MINLVKISSIPSGEKVLFDTNIFIYSALDHQKYGDSCTDLIYRVESGEIEGYSPTVVLNELLHRLMVVEVIEESSARNTKDAIKILRYDRSTIPNLKTCWRELDRIYSMRFIVLEEKIDTFKESLSIAKKYSLLAKDAYIASFARSYGITNIATNDRDFKRVEWLKVWNP